MDAGTVTTLGIRAALQHGRPRQGPGRRRFQSRDRGGDRQRGELHFQPAPGGGNQRRYHHLQLRELPGHHCGHRTLNLPTTKNTVIDGGNKITLDGQNAVQILRFDSANFGQTTWD